MAIAKKTVKKKPTAAQLAARKLFAQRARAGTLKKGPAKKKVARKTVAKKTAPKKNPILKERKSSLKANFPYSVETQATENWGVVAAFKIKNQAIEYAQALADAYPRLPVRIKIFTGGPM